MAGFDSAQTTDSILERSHRLSKSTHAGLREFTIVPDLTSQQRKDEQEKILEVKKKNLARSEDEQSKNMFYKVVGRKGAKREILAPYCHGSTWTRRAWWGGRGGRVQGREATQHQWPG